MSAVGADPIDVILRQDLAYGRTGIDYDLWMTTIQDPVRLLGTGDPVGEVLDRVEARIQLKRVVALARADGVMSMRTRILTHIQPTEDLAIVSSMRDLLSDDGAVLSTSSLTWTLQRTDEDWLISQIFFEGNTYTTRPEMRGFKPD